MKKNISNFFQFLKKNPFPLAIFLIVAIISWQNYTPGTFLSGWDTLHPEFDFGLNFKRLIFGVWRQEQGLGAVAGHSHMADLPRVLILWIFHFFLPLNSLRYLYVFLCLLLGPLGIYSLVRYLFKKEKGANLIAFLTALFYLFHLGTVQQFYVPFEMFPTQYAFLPWIILATFKFLKKPNRKNALFFLLINLFATPQAYAAHLWYAFFAVYLAFVFLYWLIYRSRPILHRCLKLIVLILVINSFWLLPNLYFIKTSAWIPRQARQNRLFSKEYQLRNRETGYLKDVALDRGFYFNWLAYDFSRQKFTNLMPSWNQHLNRGSVKVIGYLFFSFSLAGLIFAFFKKQRIFLALTPFWLGPFVILMNHTPPFEQFFDFLIRFSVFDEALRFVFTKFSILLLFGYAVFFSFFLALIFKRLEKGATAISATLLTGALVCFAWPMFQGQLISPKMRIQIPQEYFQLWQKMKGEKPGRVLYLPIHNFAGWQYYRFGYQGAGFIWFGLKQSILDRDFDRWNPENEEAFREFFYALYGRREKFMAKTLQKYNIHYIIWDRNIITPFLKNRNQVVFRDEIGELLVNLEKKGAVTKLATFGNLDLFRLNKISPSKREEKITSEVMPAYHWGFFDYAYMSHGDYLTPLGQNNSQEYRLIYPWRPYLDRRERLNEKVIGVKQGRNWWSFYPKNYPKLKVSAPAIYFSAEKIYRENQSAKRVILDGTSPRKLDYKSFDGRSGTYIELEHLSHHREYIIGFKSRHLRGLPLRICVKNLYSDICALYEELGEQKQFTWEFFPLPSMDKMIGYGIAVDNISFGNFWSENELAAIVILPVPVERVSRLYFSQGTIRKERQVLIFDQGYNPGWRALYFTRGRPHLLRKHFLVDNWANGWELPAGVSGAAVYLIFWPQILEFFGLALLVAGLATVIFRK